MLKRVQHDKKGGHSEPCPELDSGLFRNLGFGNDKKSIAFVLIQRLSLDDLIGPRLPEPFGRGQWERRVFPEKPHPG
jgi:hypothetical protein